MTNWIWDRTTWEGEPVTEPLRGVKPMPDPYTDAELDEIREHDRQPDPERLMATIDEMQAARGRKAELKVLEETPARTELTDKLARAGFDVKVSVPRCDTCRWWGYQGDPDYPPTGERRFCQNRELKAQDDSGHGGVVTWGDFGCVQWEAKDGK